MNWFIFSKDVSYDLLEKIMNEFDSVQYYDDRFSISEEEFFYDSVHNVVLCDVLFKNKYSLWVTVLYVTNIFWHCPYRINKKGT